MEHLGRLYTVDLIEPLIEKMREENKKRKIMAMGEAEFL